jgi:hypothetical protein
MNPVPCDRYNGIFADTIRKGPNIEFWIAVVQYNKTLIDLIFG